MVKIQKPGIIFMGTSEFSAVILEKIFLDDRFDIIAAYTCPDKKHGRGLRDCFSAVKKFAIERNILLFQPATLRQENVVRGLEKLKPDFIVVASYGLILPQNILDIPSFAPINVHPSLLPKYRGPSPVQTALMDSWRHQAVTGVSIMKMVAELDSGPVYAMCEASFANHTHQTLELELAEKGAELLLNVLLKITNENLQPNPQDETAATYTRKLEKETGRIDWNLSAAEIDALIRAVTPWPGAQITIRLHNNDKSISATILPGEIGDTIDSVKPGAVNCHRDGLSIACQDRWYHLDQIKPQNKKFISSKDFVKGYCKIKNGLCGDAQSQ